MCIIDKGPSLDYLSGLLLELKNLKIELKPYRQLFQAAILSQGERLFAWQGQYASKVGFCTSMRQSPDTCLPGGFVKN